MLIDTLLTHPIENVAPANYGALRQRLQRAQKFELAPDFAASAEELAVDLKTVANALPHCRLPFRLTWIEVAQQHRPRFLGAGVHMPKVQRVPTRIGFLLEATDPKLAAFTAYQFWDLQALPDRPQCSHVAMSFDPVRFGGIVPPERIDAMEAEGRRLIESFGLLDGPVPSSPEWLKASPQVRAAITSSIQPSFAPFADYSMFDAHGLNPDRAEDVVKVLLDIGILDWSGESIYLLSALTLLNTLNATQSVATDYRKLNRARAKARKTPLSDYHVLKIHPRLKRWVKGDSDAHGHRALRGHMVRGHFKVRRTGIFFWRPFARGEGKPVEKTYLVH